MAIANLAIRQATLQDAEVLAELSQKTFRDTFGPDNNSQDLELYIQQALSCEQIRQELTNSVNAFLLGWEDDVLVGYSKLSADHVPDCIQDKGSVEISRLYVDKSFLGKGYGAAMMAACLITAQEQQHTTIWLGVWEHNHRAKKFYKKWGFSTVGQHSFLLGNDNQTDDIMMRSIPVSESIVR